MDTITVVTIRDEYDTYGGRPPGQKSPLEVAVGDLGWLGNPFHLASEADRLTVILHHKRYFWERVNSDPTFREAVKALAGQRVACFCHPKACHLDNIKAWLDAGCPLRDNHA